MDLSHFEKSYKQNKNEIFHVISNCVSENNTFNDLFVLHMIIMNYSFLVLKDNPSEILLLKSFLSSNEETFMKILSLVIDVGFYISEDKFNGLNLEGSLERVEKSDFLIK